MLCLVYFKIGALLLLRRAIDAPLLNDILNDVCEDTTLILLRSRHFKHDLYLDEVDRVELVDFFAGAARELLLNSLNQRQLFILVNKYGQLERRLAELQSLLFEHGG